MVYYMLKPIPIHLLHLGSLPVIYRALAMSTAIGGNPARCVPSCGTVAWRVLAGPAGGDRNSPASSENAMFVAIPAGEHMASGPLF